MSMRSVAFVSAVLMKIETGRSEDASSESGTANSSTNIGNAVSRLKSGIVPKVSNSALQAESGNRDGCYDWRADQSAFWSSQGKSAHHLIARRNAPGVPAASGTGRTDSTVRAGARAFEWRIAGQRAGECSFGTPRIAAVSVMFRTISPGRLFL